MEAAELRTNLKGYRASVMNGMGTGKTDKLQGHLAKDRATDIEALYDNSQQKHGLGTYELHIVVRGDDEADVRQTVSYNLVSVSVFHESSADTDVE